MSGVDAELPRYKCHKEVHALKIERVIENEDGTATLEVDHGFMPIHVTAEWMQRFKPNGAQGDEPYDPGYYVVYADGYRSWSPTKAFEEGYTLIG